MVHRVQVRSIDNDEGNRLLEPYGSQINDDTELTELLRGVPAGIYGTGVPIMSPALRPTPRWTWQASRCSNSRLETAAPQQRRE